MSYARLGTCVDNSGYDIYGVNVMYMYDPATTQTHHSWCATHLKKHLTMIQHASRYIVLMIILLTELFVSWSSAATYETQCYAEKQLADHYTQMFTKQREELELNRRRKTMNGSSHNIGSHDCSQPFLLK